MQTQKAAPPSSVWLSRLPGGIVANWHTPPYWEPGPNKYNHITDRGATSPLFAINEFWCHTVSKVFLASKGCVKKGKRERNTIRYSGCWLKKQTGGENKTNTIRGLLNFKQLHLCINSHLAVWKIIVCKLFKASLLLRWLFSNSDNEACQKEENIELILLLKLYRKC